MDAKELIKFLEFNNWWDYLVIVYLISFSIQLFYYLFVFSKLAFFKRPEIDENQKLAQMRDLLLPKLMKGKIRIQ